MQVVGDGISMYDPASGVPGAAGAREERLIGIDEVVAYFGVAPERVVDVQALAGDSTDNVPGAPGIGIKTAAQLIAEYGDLDTLLARADEIKQPKRREALTLPENVERIRVSRDLVKLCDDRRRRGAARRAAACRWSRAKSSWPSARRWNSPR